MVTHDEAADGTPPQPESPVRRRRLARAPRWIWIVTLAVSFTALAVGFAALWVSASNRRISQASSRPRLGCKWDLNRSDDGPHSVTLYASFTNTGRIPALNPRFTVLHCNRRTECVLIGSDADNLTGEIAPAASRNLRIEVAGLRFLGSTFWDELRAKVESKSSAPLSPEAEKQARELVRRGRLALLDAEPSYFVIRARYDDPELGDGTFEQWFYEKWNGAFEREGVLDAVTAADRTELEKAAATALRGQ